MEKNNKYEMQQALLWNMRCLRSGFGKQTFSQKATEPRTAIGTSVRDTYGKQYMSQEQTKASPGNNSQGAIYKHYGSLGIQCESRRPSSARALIGTGPRLAKDMHSAAPGPGIYKAEHAFGTQQNSRRCTSARATFGAETREKRNQRFMDQELEKTISGRGTPGPVYSYANSLGNQVLSTKTTGQRANFGRAGRFGPLSAQTAPGPIYKAATSAIGQQTYSTRRSLPAYGFGTSTRDGSRAAYLSKEHAKAMHGVGTPGPGTANKVSAFQRQQLSHKTTQPAYGFGTSARLPSRTGERGPGPGAYCA